MPLKRVKVQHQVDVIPENRDDILENTKSVVNEDENSESFVESQGDSEEIEEEERTSNETQEGPSKNTDS